jgi:hypothetical protein
VLDDRRIKGSIRIYGAEVASEWRRFGKTATAAQESAETRKNCDKKATTDLPQRRTGI